MNRVNVGVKATEELVVSKRLSILIIVRSPSKSVTSLAYCFILVLRSDRELSLVIKMCYFNVRHTMIVTIFCSFVSFNILTQDSSGIKNKEGGLYFRQRHFRWD